MFDKPEKITVIKTSKNLQEDPFITRQENLLEIKNKEEEFKLVIQKLRNKIILGEIKPEEITPIIDKIEQDFSDNYEYTRNLINGSTPPQE